MSRFADPVNSRSFSPDGKRFAFVLKKGNLEDNTNNYSLLAMETDGLFQHPTTKLLVSFSSSSNRPAIGQITWLEDNDTILFLGENTEELTQVYAVRYSTGQLRKLTSHATNVASYSASADGQRIVYAAEKASHSLVTKDVVRYGLHVSPSMRLVDLIAGETTDHVVGGYELFARKDGAEKDQVLHFEGRLLFPKGHLFLSPDGNYLIVETLVRDLDPAWGRYNDADLKRVIGMNLPKGSQLFIQGYELIDMAHEGSRALIDAPILGTDLRWSRDSRSVIVAGAYLPLSVSDTKERAAREASTFVAEVEIPSGEITKITDQKLKLIGWEQETSSWKFEMRNSPDTVYFRKGAAGWQSVGNVAQVVNRRRPDIFIDQDLNSPPRLEAENPVTKRKVTLLDPNPQLDTLSLGRVEEIKWNDTRGNELTGGLFLPPHYEPGRKYPLVIQTHGYKPQEFWMDGPFTTAFAAQPLASKGIVVLQLTILGSGSPEEGERNLRAFESAIDYLSNRGLVDRDRVGLIGFSRTCFHVKYALTHSKFQFAAASVADGVDAGYFQYLAFGNELPQAAGEFETLEGAAPFGEGLSVWAKHSPGFLLDRVETPIEIQAIGPASLLGEWEWFAGLSRLGRAVDFLYIPTGTHVLVKPWDRVASQQTNLDWFVFWLNGEEDPDPAKTQQYARWRELRKLQNATLRKQADDLTAARSASGETGYHVTGRYNVGGNGGWDYISIDSQTRRLYVPHGNQVEVLDADSGKVVGHIVETPGVHGVAIASEFHRGFTSNDLDKTVTIFDTKTLTPIKKVQLESGTDFILYDPFSKRVFPMNEKITVIDAETGKVAGTLKLGGNPEAAVSDGQGTVYVNLTDKAVVAVIDSKTLTVTKSYPIEHCTNPHSLSYDAANERLFVGCRDAFAALDAKTGQVVGGNMICSGGDASGFDPDNKLIFESCYEGVVSVIRQTAPDYYELIETIPTQLFAGTMAFDPQTKNLYLPTAEFETIPNNDPRKPPQRRIKPQSFSVLVLGKR